MNPRAAKVVLAKVERDDLRIGTKRGCHCLCALRTQPVVAKADVLTLELRDEHRHRHYLQLGAPGEVLLLAGGRLDGHAHELGNLHFGVRVRRSALRGRRLRLAVLRIALHPSFLLDTGGPPRTLTVTVELDSLDSHCVDIQPKGRARPELRRRRLYSKSTFLAWVLKSQSFSLAKVLQHVASTAFFSTFPCSTCPRTWVFC